MGENTGCSLDKKRVRALELMTVELRKRMLTMVHDAKKGHIGGALSSTDMIAALFFEVMNVSPDKQDDPNRDIFILSKGHTLEPYLCALSARGFFADEMLNTFCKFGSELLGHPNRRVPGVEVNSGALGHGLSIASGAALAKKRDGLSSNVYVMMGDGELAEGSNWEAAMFAGNYGLDNLYAIIDRNRLQLSGPTEEIMRLEPLQDKWEAFGFHVVNVDGNDMASILEAFQSLRQVKGKPKMILSNTTKGKGVSFMENQLSWHAGAPDDEQYAIAMEELEQERRRLMEHE